MNLSTLTKFTSAALLIAVVSGCAGSNNTGYRRADFGSKRALKGHYNSGEQLSEQDVLGIGAPKTPTELDIRNALDRAAGVDLKAGDTVLALQSGQGVPDPRLVNELNKHYRAVPFSGIRADWGKRTSEDPEDHYSKALRFAAAQAGAQKILCFWGNLEVARHDLSTKTITWLPVIDVIVPDQKDSVRVHLKVAVLDVRTGSWSVFRTEPLQTDVVTTGWGREHLETPEVRDLKEKSYTLAINSLLTGKP